MKIKKCSICRKQGHNARGCVTKQREEIQKAKEAPERLEIDGIVPKKGLWIFHDKKHIVVGKIRKVTPFGEIHYTDALGTQVVTKQEAFLKGGYTYSEFEPCHFKWKIGLV